MLETALQKPSSSPSETSHALISFFRHEYPLGGAVEARFLRFFPILCDRVFGPILMLSVEKNTGGTGSSVGSPYSPSGKEISLMQSAWLNHRSQWRSPSNNVNGNSVGTSTRRAMPSTHNAPPTLEMDPVVQLLSPSNNQQQHQQHQQQLQSIHNTCFLHILEATKSSRQLKNIRLPFPFMELTRNLQESFIRQLPLLQSQQSQVQQQQDQQQYHQQQYMESSKTDELWQKLHYKPIEQKELVNQLRHHLPSANALSSNMRRSPRTSPTFHPSNQTPTSSAQQFTFDSIGNNLSPGPGFRQAQAPSNPNDLKVMLDAWEYFMILFLRHGVHNSKMKNIMQQQSKSSTSSGMYGYGNSRSFRPYGEKVYLYLFKKYCEYYIQHIFQPDYYFGRSDRNSFQQQQSQQSFDGEFDFISIRKEKSDLWMRLVMEFFIDSDHVYPTTQAAMNNLSSTAIIGSEIDSTGLGNSFELASLLEIPSKWNNSSTRLQNIYPGQSPLKVRQSYSPPSKLVQRCLYYLIDHIICDPAIPSNCNRKGGRSNSNSDPKIFLEWPLQSAQTLLQPSFYNYVRTSLRYGHVHVRNSSFYVALDLWLTWLEPWNVVQREFFLKIDHSFIFEFIKKTISFVLLHANFLIYILFIFIPHLVFQIIGKKNSVTSIKNAKELLTNVSDRVTRTTGDKNLLKANRKSDQYYTTYVKPKQTSNSKYTLAWESYIAANLHLYVIPLAIFLRRAREFDFSREGFQIAISHVQKVLRVFSPKVVTTLEKLMNHQRPEIASSMSRESSLIVLRHEKILGKYCPPRPSARDNNDQALSLEMLQQDMHALLEEIVLQHRKTVGEQDFFERIGSRIQGAFLSEGSKAEEKIIDTVVRRAKEIVHFPRNYEVFPNGKGGDSSSWNGSAQGSDNLFSPEREKNGFISDNGRSQLLEGSRICKAMDIAFIGDPMYSRVKDYEMAVLVKFTIFLSDWLNKYFKLVPSTSHHLHGDKDEDLIDLLKEEDDVKGMKYRINLRFIADTRNWAFMLVLFKIFQWLW
jgi:hypothetical protein